MEGLLGIQNHVTWLQECARAVVILGYGLLLLRLFGRRMLGKWAAPDVVVSLLVGSSLSRAMTGNAPFAGTLLACGALMLGYWIIAHAAARWPAVSRLVEGRAQLVVRGGRVDESTLRRHAISQSDLVEALRSQGVVQLNDAAEVWLEPSGKLSIVRKARAQRR